VAGPIPPGPHALPPGWETNALDVLVGLFHEHGDLFGIPLPGSANRAFVACHPDMANHVLVQGHRAYEKGQGYPQMRLLLGDGVITLDGERWVRRRRLLGPVYARGRVAGRLEAAGRHLSGEVAEQWAACADRGGLVDATRDLWRLVCSLILTLLCGEDYLGIRGTPLEDRFLHVAESSQRDVHLVQELGLPVREALSRWVTWRQEGGEEHDDLLQVLIEARDPVTGAPLTEEEVLDECVTFIVAGVETTATTLGWFWHLLATAPEAESRVLAEVDALGDRPLGDGAGQFPFTRQVLQEAMRLYPPVWIYPRIALQEDRLGDVAVPKGTHVLVATYLIHRHPAFWREPDRFLPERFDGGQSSPAFMPFGLGPRRCAGEDYSLVLALAIIRAVAAKVVLRPGGDPFPGLAARINLRPAQNLRLRPVRRDRAGRLP
jgi:cytochrome P450